MINNELITLKTKDNEYIALWKVFPEKKELNKHIFLTHGTFSNKNICMGIAKYFSESGYTCWIMEWRNHGNSSQTQKDFDFETIALFDLKTVFEYLFNISGISKIDCITHSGGGICLSMFLIKNPVYLSKLNRITMFSCQAFGAAFSRKNYYKILYSKIFSRILGFVPGKIIGLGPHNESYNTMKQWFNWNLNKNFKGTDDYNYLSEMTTIKIPILSICSKGDTMIAPKEGCIDFLNAFDNSANELLFCSKENGFKENYDHSRIILSKNSSNEIWPRVLEWITK